MLTLYPSPEWIVAFSARGRLNASDIGLVMTRTEQAIARHGIAHLFAEVANPSGLIKAMQGHWHRDMHFVRELERFGRVAIVSPNRWLRVLARVESALLPGIEYRVFSPGERTEALDWVMHGEPRNQESPDSR